MTIIEQELIQKSQAIFDGIDKWNAFVELKGLDIEGYWLKTTTKRLHEYFRQHPPDGWSLEQWGDPWDTRWYLKEFGFDSLAIGFGWKYQFQLHLDDPKKRYDSALLSEQLKRGGYAKLLMPFGVSPFVDGPHYGTKVMERNRDFTFGSPNDGNIPLHELAWYAAHRTDEFIKQAAGKIERFTRDPEMTRLLADLNAMALTKPLSS